MAHVAVMSLGHSSSRLSRRSFVCGLCAAPLLASPAFARVPAIFAQDGIAIQGFDPVGYFRQRAPVAGSDQFRLRWRNAVWRFASQRNMTIFEGNPHRFAPRYGGFCAMSMSQGRLSDSAPEAWAIYEGRLYLAHSVAAIRRWQRNPASFVQNADGHWSSAMRE